MRRVDDDATIHDALIISLVRKCASMLRVAFHSIVTNLALRILEAMHKIHYLQRLLQEELL